MLSMLYQQNPSELCPPSNTQVHDYTVQPSFAQICTHNQEVCLTEPCEGGTDAGDTDAGGMEGYYDRTTFDFLDPLN